MNNIEYTQMSCGYVNVKTVECGTFPTTDELSKYDTLPWYKKLFVKKPKTKVSSQNIYNPAEFYKQIPYRQNYTEEGMFIPTRHFHVDGVENIYIERNTMSPAYHRYFYNDENDDKIYIDPIALEKGLIVKLMN